MSVKNKLMTICICILHVLCSFLSAEQKIVIEDNLVIEDNSCLTCDIEIADNLNNHLLHQPEISKEPDDFQAKFFNMLFLLAMLIGFMFVASWALKRMMKTRVSQLNASNTIKVVESRSLSSRAILYIVETEQERLLIAESANNVTLLTAHPLNHDK